MSVMDRLKAIRERMASPVGEAVTTFAEDPAPAPAPRPAIPAPPASRAKPAAPPLPPEAPAPAPDAPMAAPVTAPASMPVTPSRPMVARQHWDMVIEADDAADMPLPPEAAADTSVPFAAAPVPPFEAPAGPAGRRSGRVKTRLLGFEHSDGKTVDISQLAAGQASTDTRFPVGWLVVVKGPGRGEAIALKAGVSQIGRDEDQGVQLDFGDTSISRANHAAIAFDEEARQFFVGHGGKSNIVRLNGKPLLSTETVANGALIRVGETTLRLVTLCGPDFNWNLGEDGMPGTSA